MIAPKQNYIHKKIDSEEKLKAYLEKYIKNESDYQSSTIEGIFKNQTEEIIHEMDSEEIFQDEKDFDFFNFYLIPKKNFSLLKKLERS